jgi:cation diffusion facilitator CzcD-associated flavoprotein CzcO
MSETSAPPSNASEISVDVLIVGAGFSGVCAGIKLREAGRNSFLIIEKSAGIGGTWWDNRYPGCACDIPSHLYSFSFEPSNDWSRMYPGQQEIHDYLKRCAERFGLAPHIRLNTRFHEAVWDETAGVWQASTQDGMRIRARVLVSGMGALHVPRYPDLKGIERFKGPAFHSATWNHSVDLDGKNVAVVGTGASAIQFVPQIAPRVGKLHLFQRTPAWIVPRLDFAFSEEWKSRFQRIPLTRWALRQYIFWRQEFRVLGFLGHESIRKKAEAIAIRHMARKIKDPKLRAALTPNYELGCKRVLVSDDFYPALTRSNVELVTDRIAEVRDRSIVTQDGVERPTDVLIYGTGFRATEPLIGCRVVGRGGVEIHDAWGNRMSAFLGVTVTGFPNFFMLLGPNTGLGHNSVVLMIEAQARYVMKCLKLMNRRKQHVIEVRPDSQKRFVEEIDRRMGGTVWQSGGCHSWYQDQSTGEITTLWPASVISYLRRTRSVSPSDYELSTPPSRRRSHERAARSWPWLWPVN